MFGLAYPPISSFFCHLSLSHRFTSSSRFPLVFDLHNGPCFSLFPNCIFSSNLQEQLLPVTVKAFSSPFGAICPNRASLRGHADETVWSLAVNNSQER